MLPAVLSNPVAVQDTREQLRVPRARWTLAGHVTLLGGTAAAYVAGQGRIDVRNAADTGAALFVLLCLVQLTLLCIVVVALMSGTIAGQRERDTWRLLVLTPLSSSAITLGKLTAGLALPAMLAVATLPIFAGSMVVGAVTLGNLVCAYCVFAATVILAGSISLVASALTVRTGTAVAAASTILAVPALGATWLAAQGHYETALVRPLVALDPAAAVLSAAPPSALTAQIGLQIVHQPFGPLGLPLWLTFSVLAMACAALAMLVTTATLTFSRRPGSTL